MRCPSRRGAVLVIVSGLAALLAALGLALLTRVRGDAGETAIAVAEAQARLMLMAACDYVLESGRVGYDRDPQLAGVHEEAYGWIDVRATTAVERAGPLAIGPRDQARNPLFTSALAVDGDGDGASDRPAWPAVGGVAICPMHRLRRPPYAIQATTAYNPIDASGLPLLANPDPQPATPNGWPGAVSAAGFGAFAAGDQRPVATSVGRAWFRCHRDAPAVFTLTCGAGATEGFRSWGEVIGANAAAQFNNDPSLFAALRAAEVVRWYRIEWSAAVGSPHDFHFVENEIRGTDSYMLHPHNATQCERPRSVRSQIRRANACGTIRWVQRLDAEPAAW